MRFLVWDVRKDGRHLREHNYDHIVRQLRPDRIDWDRSLVQGGSVNVPYTVEIEVSRNSLDSVWPTPDGDEDREDAPRLQVNRKAATEKPNEAIQNAAEEIWKTDKLLKKEDVAARLLAKAETNKALSNHLQDHKKRDGGLLAEDTLRRLISEPDWVRKKNPSNR